MKSPYKELIYKKLTDGSSMTMLRQSRCLWILGGVLFLLLGLETVCVKQNRVWVQSLDTFVIGLVRSHPPVPSSPQEAKSAPYFKAISVLTSFARSKMTITVAALIGLFYILRKRYLFGLWFFLSIASGEIALKNFKVWIARARPPTNGELGALNFAHGFSYPSGHALAASLFYGLLLLLVYFGDFSKSIKWALCGALLLWIWLMMYTRVYLGVHYPTDVLGGFLMGMAWACLSMGLCFRLLSRAKSEI